MLDTPRTPVHSQSRAVPWMLLPGLRSSVQCIPYRTPAAQSIKVCSHAHPRAPSVQAIRRCGRRCEQGCLRWYGPVMHAPGVGVGGGVWRVA